MILINSKKKNPCFDCQKRNPGCHSSCADYQEWIRKWNERKRVIFEEKKRESTLDNTKVTAVEKTKKKRRKK